MGFVSGFTGGVTLTLSVAYLSILAHQRNRYNQSLYLRSQQQLLNSAIDPEPQTLSLLRDEAIRASHPTFIETAKDRWNTEIENVVHRIQTADWDNVREGLEGTIAGLLGRRLEQSRDGIERVETAVGPKVQEAVDASKAAARRGVDEAATGLKHAASKTIAGVDGTVEKTREGIDRAAMKVDDLASVAKGSADRAKASLKSGTEEVVAHNRDALEREIERSYELKDRAQGSLSNSSGTIDAARGVVRDALNKGIGKGQELISKAQAAVGRATEKVESKVEGRVAGASDLERVLKQRYEEPHGLDKSVAEALEERYKPIEQRDNSVLRGI